ncbi:MAG TPA: hypothetical protein DCP97_04860 [Ruminococcaceae bacterium]|jgi:hypothetical protein|nr:hypothetical protein [Oscillospiraceae bacterium]
MKNLKDSLNKGIIAVQASTVCAAKKMKTKLEEKDGSVFTEYGLLIVIGVVIAGLALAGVYALFKDKIMPQTNSKVDGFFNYAG